MTTLVFICPYNGQALFLRLFMYKFSHTPFEGSPLFFFVKSVRAQGTHWLHNGCSLRGERRSTTEARLCQRRLFPNEPERTPLGERCRILQLFPYFYGNVTKYQN